MYLLIGLVLVAIIAATVVWLQLHRKVEPPPLEPATELRPKLMQIVLHEDSCNEARKLENVRFEKTSVPILPLSRCDNPQSCHCRCRYVPVEDRRIYQRRRTEDKRQEIRLDGKARRKGGGRRRTDNVWKDGGY